MASRRLGSNSATSVTQEKLRPIKPPVRRTRAPGPTGPAGGSTLFAPPIQRGSLTGSNMTLATFSGGAATASSAVTSMTWLLAKPSLTDLQLEAQGLGQGRGALGRLFAEQQVAGALVGGEGQAAVFDA